MGRPTLLLAPGAGADRTSPQLVAIDGAATAAGWAVRRMDFPYRLAGRRAPDRAPVLLDAVAAEAAALPDPGPLVAGGRSMGGRICSMAAAAGRIPAAGLVLVSYPLHPPGRPDRPRSAHLPDLGLPCLLVSGTRDPFGTPEELEAAAATIPGPVTLRLLDGRDHGLRGADAAVAAEVAAWLAATFPGAAAG